MSQDTTDSTIKEIWKFSERHGLRDEKPQIQPTTSAKGDDKSFGDTLTRTKESQVNLNIHKSLRLLDEAVGVRSPSQILRTTAAKTPFRNVSYKTQYISPASKLDTTRSPGMSFSTPGGRSRLANADVSMASVLADVTMPVRLDQTSFMMEDVTTTNIDLLLEEDPNIGGSTGLYGDFFQVMKDHQSEHQIFDLVSSYSTLCHEQVDLLKKLINRAAPGQTKFAKTVDLLNLIEQECFTWQLVYLLYQDRLEKEAKNESDHLMDVDQMGRFRTEKQIVQNLYETDDLVRQSQLVIDWLERIEAERLESFSRKVEFFQDKSVSWENTLHQLQNPNITSSRAIVTQLDPDAPSHQKRPLADLDHEDEIRLLKYLFAYIRAGQLEEAQRLCVQCGQAWRAATLEGWKLHHDTNYDSLGPGGSVQPVEGNAYRDVWRLMCWKMSKEEALHPYERAMYAAFSGNLDQLLQVCETWQDYIWAHFKVLVDTRVEQEIRVKSTGHRTFEQMPSEYWDKIWTPSSIFMNIQASSNETVRREATEKYHIIQKFIILGEIEALIEEMYIWVKQSLPNHLIRFMAHVVLFMRTIGHSCKEELCVVILEAYVATLIELKQMDLVAAYTAHLPQDHQIEWYARFLEGIHEREQKEKSLQLAEEAGLDIPSITKLVVENIRNKGLTGFSLDSEPNLEAVTTPEDRQKIEAIEWLVYDPTQRIEAVRQANAVMRTFLGLKKHAAARDVADKIPPNSIEIIQRIWTAKSGTIELPPTEANIVREYLCIQAFLDGQDSFSDWFNHYHHSKPTPPQMPASGAKFTEKVVHEHQEKQYKAELHRWKHTLQIQTKACKDTLYNVLLFVDGGWMVDQLEEDKPDETRCHQMALLRQLCLPAVCFLLHNVLHATEQYGECLQLADLISDENRQLYKVFRKDELQKFLQLLQDSSKELLEKGLDPLGYEIK